MTQLVLVSSFSFSRSHAKDMFVRSERRDFGNGNQKLYFGYEDVILTDYFVFDLEANYNLYNSYNATFSIGNILDENYEEALQYSSMGRTINFGLKRSF